VALRNALGARGQQAVIIAPNKVRLATLQRSYPNLPIVTAYGFGLSLLRAAGYKAEVDLCKLKTLAQSSRARCAKEPWFTAKVERAAAGYEDMPEGGNAVIAASLSREELAKGIAFIDMLRGPIELDLLAQVPLPEAVLVDDAPNAPPIFSALMRRLADRPPPRRRPFMIFTSDTCADRPGTNAAVMRGDTDAPASDLVLKETFLAPQSVFAFAQECVSKERLLTDAVPVSPRKGTVTRRALTGDHVARGALVAAHFDDIVPVARRGGRLHYGLGAKEWIEKQRKFETLASLTGGSNRRNKPYVTPVLELVEVRKGSGEVGWKVLHEDELGGAGAPCVLIAQEYSAGITQHRNLCARLALAATEMVALES
jgi:hypothetical protein